MDHFYEELETIVQKADSDFKTFCVQVDTALKKYEDREVLCAADCVDQTLTQFGDQLIQEGRRKQGMYLLQEAKKRPDDDGLYADGITLFLRLAEDAFEKGDEESGIDYLKHVCEEEADNYEEAIGFRGLMDVWRRYQHFVEGSVRDSWKQKKKDGKTPDACSQSIEEILALKGEDLQIQLASYLEERTAYGDDLSKLNRCERLFYELNLLCDEVNSGGLDAYLYYYGDHFNIAKKAAKKAGISSLLDLMEQVEARFPEGKIPGSLDRIEEWMDDQEMDFEVLDDAFYQRVVNDVVGGLDQYIQKNRKKFR